MIEHEFEGHKMFLDKAMSSRGITNPSIIKFINEYVYWGNTVIDVGAFMGHFTLLCARQAGSDGHVYAFEPDPMSFEFLQINVAINGYQNCTFEQRVVGKEERVAQLYRAIDCHSHNTIYESPKKYHEVLPVKMITLDDYFEDLGKSIDFIKIDVEGSEPGVLLGMETLLDKNPKIAIIMEFYPPGIQRYGYPVSMPLEFFASREFDIYTLTSSIEPINGNEVLEKLAIQKRTSTNLLFMRNRCL